MKRLGIVCGLLAAVVTGLWALGDIGSFDGGAYRSATAMEDQISVGDSKMGFYRDVIKIPVNFGKLVAITPHDTNKAVFWFESEEGLIRNVIVRSDRLLAIRRRGQAAVDKYAD